MKAITEESLTVFNKHSFAFESRLIERREDRISQILLELCERAIDGDIPVSVPVASMNRELVLRVLARSAACRLAGLGVGEHERLRRGAGHVRPRRSRADLSLHPPRDQSRLRLREHALRHFLGVAACDAALSSTRSSRPSAGPSRSSTVSLETTSSCSSRPCRSSQGCRCAKASFWRMSTRR